jgi:nicotinamidase-related amidase
LAEYLGRHQPDAVCSGIAACHFDITTFIGAFAISPQTRYVSSESRRGSITMATLTLPKGKSAILVMGCQNDIVHENGKMAAMSGGAMTKLIKERNVLSTIAKLANAGRNAKLPIIHVRHAYRPDYLDAPMNTPILASMKTNEILKDGTWGAEIHQELAPDASDIVITKTRVSSFFASPLEAILSAQGITHLILTGIATDGVVEGTARDAVDRGYYVVIPDDCCMSFSEEGHRATLRGVLGMLATVAPSTTIIPALPT